MARLVYLDLCCLKRPFDDQRSPRVQAEAAAVAALIERAERGLLQLVRSPAHDFENERNPREDRRLATALWLDGAAIVVRSTAETAERARELVELRFAALDALHAAFAEEAGASWLATTDDRLVSLGRRHRRGLKVAIANPLDIQASLRGVRE